MIAVEFREVTKKYRGQPVLKGMDFAIESGSFTVIFGGPGCGKSVVLRLMTGLEKPTTGRVFMRGEDVSNVAPGERNIGYVPQMFALYPHYKVYDNIAYPLKLMGWPNREVDPVVQQTAEMLRISHLLEKNPDQLSGGEKQRVALARGIVKKTDIYVLDDPLAGLDFKLREQLFDDLQQTQESLNATFIYTTSDPLETLILAEDVIVIDGGRAIETGPLDQVYTNPQCERTMELLGFPPTNLLPGQMYAKDGRAWCKTNLVEFEVELDRDVEASEDYREVSVAVRPQALQLDPDRINGLLSFQAEVTLREDLGGELVIHLDANGIPLLAVVRHDELHLVTDDRVTVGAPASAFVLFASDSGERIGQGAK